MPRTERTPKQRQEARNRFLRPPAENQAETTSPDIARWLTIAEVQLQRTRDRKYPVAAKTKFHRREATASSAIENVFTDTALALHTAALTKIANRKPSLRSMLDTHRTIMRGQDHAQPGKMRTVNVRVGNHAAPPHGQVPEYMKGLYTYIQESQDHPLVKAVYAHIQFETIHPFADGNGRTGRALVTQLLQSPAPFSEWILDNREEYYAQLDAADWNRFAAWLLKGLATSLQDMANMPE